MQGQQQFDLALVDYIIVIVYFLGVIAHGLWVSRGKEDSEDYFLAGRGLPWFLIGFSLFASNMSGSSFVGLMGASYENGIVVFNYEWTAAVVLIFFAFFMLPYYLRTEIYTIPEFLETRYDKKSRIAFSVFTVLAIIFIDTAGALYAGGLVITQIIDVALWQAIAGLAAVAGVYTILGGLGAVVVTDTVQAILLIIGAIAIFAFGLNEIGGWGEMTRQLDEQQQLSLIQPPDGDFIPWPGLFGVILLGFYYWTLNQFIVQRTLGARSLDQGRKGALFAGLLKIPNVFIMILPGVFAVLLYPDLKNPDLVFPTMAFDLLPIGFRGLIMTALVAAIMSSLDSALNAAATLVTMDFIKEARPKTEQDTLVKLGRVVTGIVMVIGAVYSPFIASFETLFGYFQQVLSYITPPIVAVYIFGIFWKRINAHGAFWTIVIALLVGIPMFITKEVMGLWEQWGLPNPHYLYMGAFMFGLGFVLMTGISLLTGKPDYDKISEVTFTMENYREDLRGIDKVWYKDFRWQALALFLLMSGVIIYFW